MKKIKTNLEFSHIPIILLTAKNTLQSRMEGLELGADAYIDKPFSMDLLLTQVTNLLNNRSNMRAYYFNSPIANIKSMAYTKADGTYKRILAAPKPQKIVELETIRTLVDAGQVVIAAGGGGIPVMEQGIDLHGASAIIEKDLSSGLLAQELNADTLLILTSVEKVSLNLGQDNEEYLNTISVDDAKKYMADNQFAPGSMLPKFEAGISFIEKGDNRRTIITDIAHAKDGYFEKTGTIIK